jgi:agmatinase
MTSDNISRDTADRMDLPFVGLATFAHQPACPDWDKLNGADVALLGIPFETASSYRVGRRFGPAGNPRGFHVPRLRAGGRIRFVGEVTYLTAGEVKIVDAGDSDVIYADTKRRLANAEQAVCWHIYYGDVHVGTIRSAAATPMMRTHGNDAAFIRDLLGQQPR